MCFNLQKCTALIWLCRVQASATNWQCSGHRSDWNAMVPLVGSLCIFCVWSELSHHSGAFFCLFSLSSCCTMQGEDVCVWVAFLLSPSLSTFSLSLSPLLVYFSSCALFSLRSRFGRFKERNLSFLLLLAFFEFRFKKQDEEGYMLLGFFSFLGLLCFILFFVLLRLTWFRHRKEEDDDQEGREWSPHFPDYLLYIL